MEPLAICATQLAGGLLLKMLKYFEVMIKFEFSHENFDCFMQIRFQ